MSSDPLNCPPLGELLEALSRASDDRMLGNESAEDCAALARECGTLAARAFYKANMRELGRKPLLAGIRDRLMDSEGLKATPAEAKARETAEYLAYAKEAEAYATMGQHFAAHRDYYRQRADLLMKEVG